MKPIVMICSLLVTMLQPCAKGNAQIPLEILAGHKKASVDMMFFRYIKNKQEHPSAFLFFNRNRASIDYAMTKTTDLPQFGFTEAISYNHKKLKGFAPVAVVQIVNKGIYPKAGIQYARSDKHYTVFSWLVCETLTKPNIDFFLLARYTPALNKKFRLFTQIEFVNAFPSASVNNFNFVQRIRLGLKRDACQFGAGMDLTETGREVFRNTSNIGGFLRYEF